MGLAALTRLVEFGFNAATLIHGLGATGMESATAGGMERRWHVTV